VGPEEQFQALLQRIRAGDGQAAAELVRQYEPEIRRTVRVRLRGDSRLRRVFDSMDVCQSVLASFFARAALGQFELAEPRDVLKLLVTMARNKLNEQVRKNLAQRRDQRRQEGGSPEALAAVPDRDPTPSQIVAGEELLVELRRHLAEDERHLADQRALGREWADIAKAEGGSPDALRMKLQRAIDRVSQQLGL
jgi:RNA polymerase sigma factor (sigma-70 family)